MIMRDNQGKIVNQIEHIWDGNGGSVSTNTTYVNEKPVVQLVTIRDGQGMSKVAPSWRKTLPLIHATDHRLGFPGHEVSL